MSASAGRTVRVSGWGWEGVEAPAKLRKQVKATLTSSGLLRKDHAPLRTQHLAMPTSLPAPAFPLPSHLSPLASTEARDRLRCSRGMSSRDILRGVAAMGSSGTQDAPVDYVLCPRSEEDVLAALRFASCHDVAVIPRGGGTSVVGALEPTRGPRYKGFVSLDLRHMAKLVSVDKTSMVAEVEAGMLGPALEDALRAHDLTLRFFPQSFEFSSVGGWVATRAGGHFATGPTHIDDVVHALRIVTPTGVIQTPLMPASGAGPSPKRLFIGSEGSLGVITRVWLRVQPRPKHRASATATFPDFMAGATAVRKICQSGLLPSNCRLVSPMECLAMGLGDGTGAVLLLAFESAVVSDFSPQLRVCKKVCAAEGGTWTETPAVARAKSASETWKNNFIRAPYLRDAMALDGIIIETFETAVRWDLLPSFYQGVTDSVMDEIERQGCQGYVTCRLTHCYADGCAPYFTVVMVPTQGSSSNLGMLKMWDAVKHSASSAILRLGGTCTHHHAVGKDHRPYYEQEVGDAFLRCLAAVKRTVDPSWVCAPGVVIPERLRYAVQGEGVAPRSRL